MSLLTSNLVECRIASHGLTRKTHRYFYLWVFAFAIVTKTNRYLRVTVTDLERVLPGTDTLTAFLPAPVAMVNDALALFATRV